MNLTSRIIACFLFVFSLFCSPVVGQDRDTQTWAFDKGSVWTRDPGTISQQVSPENRAIVQIEHTGKNDWAFSSGQRIAVKSGDVFDLSVRMRNTPKGENAIAGCSVVLRDKDGEAVKWAYSTKNAEPSGNWVHLQNRFMIPDGVATIEPRLVGYGPVSVEFEDFFLRTVKVSYATALGQPDISVLQNEFLELKIDFFRGSWSVKDHRTNRIWTPSLKANSLRIVEISNAGNPQAKRLKMLNQEYMSQEFTATISLVPDSPEFTVVVDCDDKSTKMESEFAFPPPFASTNGDRLIVPVNEGMGYPVDHPNPQELRVHKLIAYGGHGICMGFWGQVEDTTGAGYMGILETSDDAAITIEQGSNKLLQITPVWDPSQGSLRYERRIRYVFFDQGGYVAVCKRYRDYAKSIGLWVPFTEKIKKNPNIDLLIGAANIWCWERDKLDIIKELKDAGIDRILWSGGGTADEIAAMNKIPNVLSSRYDIYQDIMDPGKFDEIRSRHGDWVDAAWPNDINWTSPDGTWRKGWQIANKDSSKPMIPCAVICDAKAIPYAKERISKELESKPFHARFIDTTVAAPWFECYHPGHPMSRSDSKQHKMELLKLICDYGLVCGSETGHEASVPFCDFYEGMMSLGPYRVDDSGRNMQRIVETVPPQIENFQVNEQYRLPLWELVYHDCTVSYWYWGDYNNKLPAVWKKRDLFNALYGVPPMYMFNKKLWDENKERFAESYKIAEPVSRLTGYSEMLEHKILTKDRTVQQTRFANGVVVTANFGEKPHRLSEQTTISGNDINVEVP